MVYARTMSSRSTWHARARRPAAPRGRRAQALLGALLWLLIALMPLRALSQVLMPGRAAAVAVAVAVADCHGLAGAMPAGPLRAHPPADHPHPDAHGGATAADAGAHHPAAAAHDAGAHGAGTHDAGAHVADTHDAGTGANCHACDLCHAALALPAPPRWAGVTPALHPAGALTPRWAAAPDSGIFRPPRG